MQTQNEIIVLIVVTTVLFFILLSIILIIFSSHKKQQQSFITEIEVVKAGFEEELLKTQLEIQEETFEHISLELHDNVGHFISLAKLYLTTIKQELPNEIQEKIEASVLLLGLSIDEIRTMSKSLNTENIKNNGLVKTIKQLISQLEKTGQFTVEFIVNGTSCFLEDQKEIVLFRIVQESLNNILKHSKANKIKIEIIYNEHTLGLTISDNGVGFDVNNILEFHKSNTSGLQNIIKRSRLINATHQIQSVTGAGTTISILTPY